MLSAVKQKLADWRMIVEMTGASILLPALDLDQYGEADRQLFRLQMPYPTSGRDELLCELRIATDKIQDAETRAERRRWKRNVRKIHSRLGHDV